MNEQIDSSIPVLTEIILPASLVENPKPQVTQPVPRAAPSHIPAAVTIKPAENETAEISPEVWRQLEHTVRENVLRQVMARIDFVLEHRVRDSLADVLQGAVDKLADDIRSGLRQSLEEVITRAVTQELAKAKLSR